MRRGEEVKSDVSGLIADRIRSAEKRGFDISHSRQRFV